MKTLCAATGAALLACNLAGIAQTEAACGQILDAPLRSRAVLTIDSRPAGLEIVGTDQEAIHLSCTVRDAESARDIRLRFSGNQDDGKLTITGGALKNGNLQIRIEVPRKTSLKVQMAAGEVKVEGDRGRQGYRSLCRTDLDFVGSPVGLPERRPIRGYRRGESSGLRRG